MMMNTNQKQKPSSLIHQKIRNAAFVPIDKEQNGTFKYLGNHLKFERFKKIFLSLKRKVNSVFQHFKLVTKKFKWNDAVKDSFAWITEAMIEGLTANFATHNLFGLDFNVWMILSHGILIKQGLDIIYRLKQNGADSKLLK